MITMLVLQFWLANSPLVVMVETEYATPRLCYAALMAQKWEIPKDENGKPIHWAFLYAKCEAKK